MTKGTRSSDLNQHTFYCEPSPQCEHILPSAWAVSPQCEPSPQETLHSQIIKMRSSGWDVICYEQKGTHLDTNIGEDEDLETHGEATVRSWRPRNAKDCLLPQKPETRKDSPQGPAGSRAALTSWSQTSDYLELLENLFQLFEAPSLEALL